MENADLKRAIATLKKEVKQLQDDKEDYHKKVRNYVWYCLIGELALQNGHISRLEPAILKSFMYPNYSLMFLHIYVYVTGFAKTWHNVARTEIHFIA